MGLLLPRAVTSQPAENAEAAINLVYGWYAALPVFGSGVLARADLVVLPHIVAVGEEFTRETLLVCSEHQLDKTSSLQMSLWSKGEQDAERSWPNLRQSWKDWHGIDLAAFPDNDAIVGYIDARNAVVHGLGRLTRTQCRPDGGTKVRRRLAQAGIAVVGDAVQIDGATVAAARTTVTSLVRWLDERVRGAGLWPP